jgi:hypothetical protein
MLGRDCFCMGRDSSSKRYHSVVTHVLYHFCDMSLITACTIFCSLKFHVVCTCTFFGDTICLLTNPENGQDIDSDWFTYCIDIWLLTLLFSLQYLSESCFGNDNTFLSPNPWVVLFFIYPTFYSLRCHALINNDHALNDQWIIDCPPCSTRSTFDHQSFLFFR